MSDDQGQRTPGRRAAGPNDEPVAVALEQDFDGGSLYALRSAVSAHAAAAGLAGIRVYDIVAAAHELAANAVRHGAGRGRLRLWTHDGVLTCQVSDDGPAASGQNGKPGEGPTAPWPAEHGHGLWVVGQIADQFSIDRGPAGTTATFAFTIPARLRTAPFAGSVRLLGRPWIA